MFIYNLSLYREIEIKYFKNLKITVIANSGNRIRVTLCI